jgi:uncharacterized protein
VVLPAVHPVAVAAAAVVAAVAVVEVKSMIAKLPILGVGMGFREPYRSDLFLNRNEVDFLEITADHYMEAPPEKEEELDLLAGHFTLIPHGLNLSLGSAEGVDRNYLLKLAKLIKRLAPPWWSEHIAFTRAGGVEIGHLSPLPFTREAVEVVCNNILEVRMMIDQPLILENITYMHTMPGAEMSEAEFITEVVERTDSGLLLDITNLYINSVNHDYDLYSFLNQLPLERVVQIHFVGGHWNNGMLIDSHSHPTPDEVWQIMETIVRRAPVKGMILERDENLPAFEELSKELDQARSIWRKNLQWA